VGNETYKVNATMVFYRIIISDSYIVFNATGFNVSSPNSITITLVTINDDISGAVNGEKVLDFYGSTTGGKVWFNLSGFPGLAQYTVKRDSVTIATCTANASGSISFSSSSWSSHRFQVYQLAAAPSDGTPPVISSVGVASSSPLDVSAGYGWENFSCVVTDNVAVDTVVLQVVNPDDSHSDFTMTKRGATTTYYSNRSFHTQGNYSYTVSATDTSDNDVVSSVHVFSLPPNWDINSDGVCTILDLVLISNHYGETGSFGWMRSDVDNNGVIQVLDIVIVSGYFGTSWWEAA
jgi:hypothetical protein